MSLFLGLDGGGTGCRAVLADATGAELGRAQGGPCNIMSDAEGALASLLDCAGRALDGRDPGQVTAVLGMAGVNTSGAAEWLPPLLPFGRVKVVQDAAIAAAGALGLADGIVAAMGTGSVFIRQSGGNITTIGGWGPILGDEGSGNWLGRRLLAHVLRAGDGLAEDSPLVQDALARHGGRSGIVAFARSARGSDFGAEVPHILQAQDDPVARAILSEAAELVAASVGILQRHGNLPVVFAGGLGPAYAALLAGRWQTLDPLGSPLDGALLMARQYESFRFE